MNSAEHSVHLPAARAGDAGALGQLLEEYRDYLLRVARDELGDDLRAKGGASDLVQQTMLDATGEFPKFDGVGNGQLRAWLRRILLNNVASFGRWHRAAKRQAGREVPMPEGSAAGGATGEPSPSSAAVAAEEATAVRRALDRLPAEHRQLLLLRFQEGLSFEEMGATLGLTPNAARQRWRRAVKRLQTEMDPP